MVTASVALYLSQPASLPRNGGSWQGYGLGGLGTLLIVWLAWLGIRKRSFQRNSGSLQAWTSAHVYLGLSLPVVVTLHCAFQFGWNIHTLAYALMAGVIVSGGYGLYSYLRFPRLLVDNRGQQSMDMRLQELALIDQAALDTAGLCDDIVQSSVNSALERTAIGGSFWDQLRARDRSLVIFPATPIKPNTKPKPSTRRANTDQEAIITFLTQRIPDTSKHGEVEQLRDLLKGFGRRAEILRRVRREVSLQLRLKLWLCFHIPLTVALIVALGAHIFSVFFYW